MENKDYTVEILEIIRSNTSPGIMRSRLEDYHANDLAEVFPQLKISERRKICRILDLDILQTSLSILMNRQQPNIWMRWISRKQQQSCLRWRQML